MAQAYFPTLITSPSKESTFTTEVDADMHAERQFRAEDVQEAYVENKDRLVNALDSTKGLMNGIRTFNRDEWAVRYPQLRESTTQPQQAESSGKISQRKLPRRSLSFADDPSFETEVALDARVSPRRSVTMSSVAEEPRDNEEGLAKESDNVRLIPADDFNVLRLDLRLGSHSSSTAASLVSQLEKASIANLLDERLASSVSHIDKLRLRVEDTSSKVLVTGDLNAGKSTFVNALLRRTVMPVDQQPCTTAFCEVHDAAENDGKEEVHICKEGLEYDLNDKSTYTAVSIEDLESVVEDNEEKQPIIKLYLADTRAPSESLLNNGVVDISLIDAPGLNRDSLKTTAVFARQEEIDVVVYVVDAGNHFTLSAKEFLTTASREKAYLFIVVNKYDQIKNKDKCRRLILEQIKQLSPRTYEDAKDLVHFVDSAAALQPYAANPAFDDLESSLRSFVLVKRSKSKLQPVSTFLSNLLADIELLASANTIVAEAELSRARGELDEHRPILEKMKKDKDVLEPALEAIEEEGASKASSGTKAILNNALERVGSGKLGVDVPSVTMPTYPGLLAIWDYARDVRQSMLASVDAAVKLAEDEARVLTANGVEKIRELGEEHLPLDVERSKRVFMPEAMFSVARRAGRGQKSRRSSSYSHIGGAIVAGGLHGLGIGLAQRPDMLETTFFDLFDVNHQFLVHFSDAKDDSEVMAPTALSVVGVGLGALTMVGGQAIGARAVIEGIVKISDILSNDSARKWVAPVIGAGALGAAVYLILELPTSIPRTVGRRIKASITRGDGTQQEVQFVDGHAERISRETRKVLRLASWDLRERFRGAFEERAKDVRGAEKLEKEALKAKGYFEGVARQTVEIREQGQLESIGA